MKLNALFIIYTSLINHLFKGSFDIGLDLMDEMVDIARPIKYHENTCRLIWWTALAPCLFNKMCPLMNGGLFYSKYCGGGGGSGLCN